jgi:hypothetical protein
MPVFPIEVASERLAIRRGPFVFDRPPAAPTPPHYARRERSVFSVRPSVCPVSPFVFLRSFRHQAFRDLRSAWNQRTVIADREPSADFAYRVGRWQEITLE